jgi:hypothetical protein
VRLWYTIDNDGPEITSTNFFGCPWAETFCYVSGSVARLLIPDSQQHTVSEMHTGKILRPNDRSLQRKGVREIMFDDKSRAPHAVVMTQDMCDFSFQPSRLPFKLSAWTRNGR